MQSREFDVVVWGATGFTGRLVAEYLLERHGAGSDAGWAIAGRDLAKLERVRADLGDGARDLPILTGDASDRSSLERLAAATRVVCTTVGPYARYGSELVAACTAQGTHYCDLTGEVHWMRRMIDLHHADARAGGTRIVHTCGFDSIPSDLGVHFLQREMQRRHGVPCSRIKFRGREFRGGFSGGTVASMLNMLDEAGRDPAVAEVLRDPYGLNPEGERRGLDGPDRLIPEYDPDFDGWVAPFVMGAINTRVVRRTNAILEYPYGRDFRYEEGMVMPFGALGFPLAVAVSTASAAGAGLVSIEAARRGLAHLLPAPGEGPSRQARERGYFVIELFGARSGDPGASLRARIRGDRDPGYGSTARMLGESAMCLARDPLDTPGGVLTPAAAMGDRLIERLERHAGVGFELI
jgi:short subunit dehydrogenase-like uncharacterized protein